MLDRPVSEEAHSPLPMRFSFCWEKNTQQNWVRPSLLEGPLPATGSSTAQTNSPRTPRSPGPAAGKLAFQPRRVVCVSSLSGSLRTDLTRNLTDSRRPRCSRKRSGSLQTRFNTQPRHRKRKSSFAGTHRRETRNPRESEARGRTTFGSKPEVGA